jgi:hypothetical protein
MNKILFTNGNVSGSGTLGNITRIVAIVDEINKIDGNVDIVFRAGSDEKHLLQEYDYQVIDGYQAQMFGLPKFIGTRISKSSGRAIPPIKDMEFVIRLKGILSNKYIKTTFKEEMKFVEEYSPDTIYGCFDLIMPIVAKKLGVRYVAIAQTPMIPSFSSELFPEHKSKDYTDKFNKMLTYAGLPLISSIRELFFSYYSTNVIVPSIKELEDLPHDNKIQYVGSIVPDNFSKQEFNWIKKKPLIYVYLSVGQITPRIYIKELINTFSDSAFDVLVAIGDNPFLQGNDRFSVGNVHFYKHLPSDKIMDLCDIVIHHGGQNSTVQAIESRVPAMIFPGLHFERHYNGKKAQEAHCAKIFTNEQFNKKELLKAAHEMLENTEIKSNLEIYSKRIKESGGKKRAAQILLNNKN